MRAKNSQNRVVSLLQAGFARAKKQNAQISQRALATKLGLTSSYVSKIMRGERPVPPALLGRFAKALQLDHHEVAEIQRILLKEVESRDLAPTTGIRTLETPSTPSLPEFTALGPSDFWLLDRWYYLPLLNLATTSNFSNEPASVAKRLGLSVVTAERAMTRLVEAGYLVKTAEGKLVRAELKFRFPTQRSHESVRKYHQAMIAQAQPLLTRAPTDEEFATRLLSGITLAGDPKLVPQAKVVIEEALYRAAEILAAGDCTEVFQLNLQLFPLSR